MGVVESLKGGQAVGRKFQVGDRVKVKGVYLTGRHGTVTRYEPSYAFRYEVAIDDSEHYCWFWARELDKEGP